MPSLLVVIDKDAEVLFQPLVGTLGLTVCLRVIGCADVLGDS